MNKIAVYTCVTGGYDSIKEDHLFEDGVDYHFYTEKDTLSKDGWWEYRHAKRLFIDPRRDARRYKILSHRFFPEYDYTVWIDGSIQLDVKATTLIDEMGDADMLTFRHPERTTVAEEAEECMTMKLDNTHTIAEHALRMHSEGFPDDVGLYETKCVVRKNNPTIELLNREWFYQMVNGSLRDQLSLPYAVWYSGAKVKTMEPIRHSTPERRNDWFKFSKHPERTVYK